MALSLTTEAGIVKIPSVVVSTKVQSTAGGLGTTGVIALVGEADVGVPFSAEEDISLTAAFGPDQYADVLAKYVSGPLVDAFREAVAASDDPDIQGAPAQFVLVQTNSPTKASATLPNLAATTWSTLSSRKRGLLGNQVSRTVTQAVAEVVPTTGTFTYLPPIATTDINFRVSGGAAIAFTVTVGMLPTAFVSGVDALSGVAATGGSDRGIIGSVTGTVAVAVVSGNTATFTRSVSWTVVPTVGDTLYVPSGSAFAGAANANVGSYVVTAATSTVITATKLLDASGAANALTAPVGVSATSIVSTTADLRAFAPVTVSYESTTLVDGLGKSLEIAELTSSSGRLSYLCYQLNTTPVTWVSKSGTPVVLTSGAEYKANVNASRQSDGLNEDVSAGGRVVLTLGYLGTTASAVVTSTTMTITVVGGSGTSPGVITLANFTTVADLAAYLNTLTGFSAAPATAALGSQPATSLDTGTYNLASTFGAKTGRIKQDAYLFKAAFAASSNLELTGTLPTSGSPAVASAVFMTGAVKGGTTDASVSSAMTALQAVDCNFVVPLFSNDAGTDIADALTDSSSTYTIDGINASTRSHVLVMSTLKTYKPRQAFLSKRGTFAQAKDAAGNTASFRCAMTFQDQRVPNTSGTVTQFRPWMTAVKAAGMQAAAFRKLIVNKGVNTTGALQAAGDFNPRSPSDVEGALESGLLIMKPADGGGWTWVSDQTTYSKDDSFFFNSIQAVYMGDIIGRTLKVRLEKAIVGQSVADMGRSQILSILRLILDDLRALKVICPSDGAPLGYINEDVKVTPPTVRISVGVFEATGLYFVPVQLSISAVQQTG
jgi:hypothetical protein